MFGWFTGPTRGELRIRVAFLEQQLVEAKERETYWQRRAEMFLDRASAKAGLTHEPVMTERSVEQLAGTIPAFAGVGMNEFNSKEVGDQ